MSWPPKLDLTHFKDGYNNLDVLLEGDNEVELRITGTAQTIFDEDFSAQIFTYRVEPSRFRVISPVRHFEVLRGSED